MTPSIETICAELDALPRKRDNEVYLTDIEAMAERIPPDNAIAGELWAAGSLPARMLAIRIADPDKMSGAMLEEWVAAIDHIRLADSLGGLVVAPCPLAVPKIREWAAREGEFERAAAFAAMARLALLGESIDDLVFVDFLPLIRAAATDERSNVKRTVNAALYEIGRRNNELLRHVLALAAELQQSGSEAARWVGTNDIGNLNEE